ncbi:MAG: SCP-2 sterol transfer family protein [Deltaproteobacteria bacterium]|nr:SCP-2 sterol transfer family protein [Deltaproteobacteria bacterium]
MPGFLTDEWFEEVRGLNEAAGDIAINKAMKAVVVNLTVSTGGNDVLMCMNRGFIEKGNAAKADVQMTMPADYALAIMVRGEWSAGMKGWVKRKIKVNGNMRKLIPLQVHDPTPDQAELRKKIESITD